jgi:hypothetical protein
LRAMTRPRSWPLSSRSRTAAACTRRCRDCSDAVVSTTLPLRTNTSHDVDSIDVIAFPTERKSTGGPSCCSSASGREPGSTHHDCRSSILMRRHRPRRRYSARCLRDDRGAANRESCSRLLAHSERVDARADRSDAPVSVASLTRRDRARPPAADRRLSAGISRWGPRIGRAPQGGVVLIAAVLGLTSG